MSSIGPPIGGEASTQSSDAATSTWKPPSKDPAWKYTGLQFPPNCMKIVCKLCQKKFSGGITRAKEHLLHKTGNVTGCPNVTMDQMKEIKEYNDENCNRRNEKKRLNNVFEGHERFLQSDGEEDLQILEGGSNSSRPSIPNATKGKKRKLVSSHRGPMDAHLKPKQTQNVHSNPYKEEEKQEAWVAIEEWACEVGLPFNAVRVPSFQTMIYAIGKYGRGLQAPSYHHMRVTLLKQVYEDTQKFVESFRPYWKRYGCSIMSDFWTDGKGRSLINFLVNCPKGTVFLKSIDASEHVKRADLIVEMIEEVIKDVGEDNIVQFITDNGSNFKSAGSILEGKYPKMFWAPCAAHCLNLMVKDLGESKASPLDKIENALKNARSIVVYIYNHGRILSLMRKCTNNRELHRSCVTRFATQFYTLESMVRNENALRMMFVSNAWTTSDFSKTIEGRRVARIVHRKKFWDNAKFACSILAPLVDVIRLVDTEEKPCMGYLHEAMDRAREQIKKNIGEDTAKTNEARRECRRVRTLVWNMIDKRWDDQLDRPLHSAGLYLNPGIYYKYSQSSDDSLSIEGNAEVKRGLFKVFNRLVPDLDENDKLIGELVLYRETLQSFGEPQAIRTRETLAPAEWWITFGSSAKNLQKLAIRVLSQTCSASPCERNWSAFDNIHSKKRNCLLQNKLNQIVYIQYNKKLARRFNARVNDGANVNPVILREVDENDDWVTPTSQELEDFVRVGDDLTWSQVENAMGPHHEGPSTRTRVRIEDEDELEEPWENMAYGSNQENDNEEIDELDDDADIDIDA